MKMTVNQLIQALQKFDANAEVEIEIDTELEDGESVTFNSDIEIIDLIGEIVVIK